MTRLRPGSVFIVSMSVLLVESCANGEPENLIRVSGHVEATAVRVAPEVGGRIVELAGHEGDRIETGALLLKLDVRDIELALQRSRAEQAQAEAQLRLLQAGARPEDIRQAAAQVTAASIALPPCIRVCNPAIAASGWLVATMPFFASTVERLEWKNMAGLLLCPGVRLH